MEIRDKLNSISLVSLGVACGYLLLVYDPGSDGYNCATEREFCDSLAHAAPNLVICFDELSLHNKKQEELMEASAQTLALCHAEEQRKIESEFARTRASLVAIPQAPPLTSTAPGYSPLRPVTREGIPSPAPVQGSRVKEEGDMPSTFTPRFGVRALAAPTPLELAQRERDESLSHATVRYEHSLKVLNLQFATRVLNSIDGFPTFEAKAVSIYKQLCEQALGALQLLLQPETSRQLLHAAEITRAASLDSPLCFVDVWRSIRAMVPKDDMRAHVSALPGLTKPMDLSLLDRSEYELIVDSGAGKNICLSCYLHDLTPVDGCVRWGNGAQDAVIGEGLLVVDVWSKHPFSSDERMQRLEILCWGVDSCLVPLLSTRNLAAAGIKTIFSNESGLRADYLDLGDGVRLSLDARSRLSCSIVKPSDFETRYQEWASRVSSDSSFCAAWLDAMDSDTHYAEMMTAGVAANKRQHDDE